jgi:hypothetical protein
MSKPSLFEREMRSQVQAAEKAVAAAEVRSDPLLIQATRNNLDSLLSLARRNGLTLDPVPQPEIVLEPEVALESEGALEPPLNPAVAEAI